MDLAPMEARSVDILPEGPEWQYEPKWDGFRCILVRRDVTVRLHSKSGEDLTRYFPELVEAALALKADDVTLDGEIVVPKGAALSFDDLLQRIHPAESRIRKLASETPARFIAFDLLSLNRQDLASRPLSARRPALERFAKRFKPGGRFDLSPFTASAVIARKWLALAGGGFDGVIAKRTDVAYQAGNREGMHKIKHYRSADCVIGGFRYAESAAAGRKVVGSLLLGLYDDQKLLHHVGFTSAFKAHEKQALTDKLLPLVSTSSFTGNAPGGPSRWSTRRSSKWVPLTPKLVVEVSYDHFSGGRFRHGTRILRWRPDKKPQQCTMEQLKQKSLSVRALLARKGG
jgi:ATP-dependent DNA ligase